jgi:flavodoxin
MRAAIVYESMYGNTRRVAEAIGRRLGRTAEVIVVPVGCADPSTVNRCNLVVVGGPTHIHGKSRTGTRRAAIQQVAQERGRRAA